MALKGQVAMKLEMVKGSERSSDLGNDPLTRGNGPTKTCSKDIKDMLLGNGRQRS